DGRVRATGNNQSIFRHALVSVLVVRFGRLGLAFRRVEIAQSQVGRVIFGMRGNRTREETLRQLGVAGITRQITQGGERLAVVVVEFENFGKGIASGVF